MHVFETTIANRYFYADVRVAAHSEAEARSLFREYVCSDEVIAAADEEREMWVEEVGPYDHEAYTYTLSDDTPIIIVREHVADDKPVGVVTLYGGGRNG